MSIFWRAAAHKWKSQYGGESQIDLGSYKNKIRSWLLGESAFPQNVWLLVSLASENKDIFSITTPITMQVTPYHVFLFYIPGIEFALCVGKEVVASMRKCCFYTMPDHPIFVSKGVAARLHRVLDQTISGGAGSIKLDRWLEREDRAAKNRRTN